MQRRFRLSRSEDFKRVRRNGKSYAHPLVVLVAHANHSNGHLKIGIAAGKTTGSAVHRNRSKRLLREAMRTFIPAIGLQLSQENALRQTQDTALRHDFANQDLAPGWDLILIARPGLFTATLTDTRSALASLLKRARLLPIDES